MVNRRNANDLAGEKHQTQRNGKAGGIEGRYGFKKKTPGKLQKSRHLLEMRPVTEERGPR